MNDSYGETVMDRYSFRLTDMDRYRKIWTDTDEKLWTSVEPSTSFINNPEAHGIRLIYSRWT